MDEQIPIGENIIDYLQMKKNDPAPDKKLDEWLASDPENKRDLDKYEKIWESTSDIPILKTFNAEEAWSKTDSEIQKRTTRIRQIQKMTFVLSGMAASFIIFFSLYFTVFSSQPEAIISMSTTYGSRSEVVLPDGSRVKLNAGSNLNYHFDKVRQTRKVDFKGEAFFEVSKSKKPFVIETPDGLKVKVLGTKFNLSTYPDDQVVQTSLFEGKVELSHEGSAGLTLVPGQMAILDRKSNKLKYREGEISHTTSWMQNKLYMENMSLKDVCKYLERWYDVQITLSDPQLGEKIHYTGVFKEQTVLDVLNALTRLSSISYELKGKEIKISAR
jgi:transmembrane sensor